MKLDKLKKYFTEREFEEHGRCRGRSGACYILASKRGNWDYDDKQCRDFVGVKLNDPDADWIWFKFSVSRTALARKWVKRLTSDREEFLLQAGLLKFKRFLIEDDSPGRSEEYMLDSHSSEDEFVMQNPEKLRSEVMRVKREVLDLLWQNRHRGIKRTDKKVIEDAVCTAPSVLVSVLDLFEQRKFITGAYGSSGMKITAEGDFELERLQAAPQETKVVADRVNSVPIMGEYDVFISHASEDKIDFVRPLSDELIRLGLKVWFDEVELTIGDSVRRTIEKGLNSSKYGIVVISPYFLSKDVPQKELSALFSLESGGQKVILPIWHNIDLDQIKKSLPLLADKWAARSSDGVKVVAKQILKAMNQ